MNFKVRAKNPAFWLSVISAFFLLLRAVADLAGWDIPIAQLNNIASQALNLVFAVLTLVGVVNDPTTVGLYDSKDVLSLQQPYKD